MLSNTQARTRARMIEGAHRYAASDRSDPFTLNRCISHIMNGVASANNAKQEEGFYDAEEYQESREYNHDGRTVKYTVPAYRNIIRP